MILQSYRILIIQDALEMKEREREREGKGIIVIPTERKLTHRNSGHSSLEWTYREIFRL